MTASLGRLGFLLLDDNDNMLRILKAVLRGFGVVQTLEASNAPTAFAMARDREIDFMFVDYALPGMDGPAFTRLMRTAADSPNPHVPIIMISAHSELHRVETARDAGAHDFIVKPIAPIEIWRKIVDVVERPRTFVRSGDFFGPDRRRRREPDYAGPERRVAPAGPGAGMEAEAAA